MARPSAVAVVAGILACSAPVSAGLRPAGCPELPPSPSPSPSPSPAGYQPPDAALLRIELAYLRDLPCKNWASALEIAKRMGGCGAGGNRITCPRCALPCNICQFIEDGHFPEARISSHINLSLHPISGVGPPKGSTDGVKVVAFRNWLCEQPQHRDTLAQAMLHEAIHLCKEVAPPASTMSDGPLRDWLDINPWPFPKDTKDLTDECWKNR